MVMFAVLAVAMMAMAVIIFVLWIGLWFLGSIKEWIKEKVILLKHCFSKRRSNVIE